MDGGPWAVGGDQKSGVREQRAEIKFPVRVELRAALWSAVGLHRFLGKIDISVLLKFDVRIGVYSQFQ